LAIRLSTDVGHPSDIRFSATARKRLAHVLFTRNLPLTKRGTFSSFNASLGTWIALFLPYTKCAGGTMTKNTTAMLSAAQKRPARLADGELSHLEAILGIAGRRSAATAVRGLDLAYWSARIASVATQYDLLMSQTQRVAALSRSLAALEPTDKTIVEHSSRVARLAA
jgi:hypothetical protein